MERQTSPIEFGNLEARALAAYSRRSEQGSCQPAKDSTEVHTLEGEVYVTLSNCNGVLACYTLRKGNLVRLAEVPTPLAA